MSHEGEILVKIGSILLINSRHNGSMVFQEVASDYLGETNNYLERITSFWCFDDLIEYKILFPIY